MIKHDNRCEWKDWDGPSAECLCNERKLEKEIKTCHRIIDAAISIMTPEQLIKYWKILEDMKHEAS